MNNWIVISVLMVMSLPVVLWVAISRLDSAIERFLVWNDDSGRRRRIRRLQSHWLDFKFCRECSCVGTDYWSEFQIDYYNIRKLVERYL